MRGTRTQGYGTVGQHRKAGQRAGKGKTTQWKKSKKSYYLKQKELGFPDPDWDFGKRGFKRPQDINRIYHVNALNLKDLDAKIEDLTLKNVATKSGNTYTLNLKDINIQKILGRGDINKKINLTVNKASKRAIEKIESAGGKVTLLSEAN
ncbi:MAG: uL15 family ribosomal protein [Candidatus Lokiarchaeota archaeon]|jgi:large subunit ribosomal protein L15|nr:uL15 family ribosomal protein [Candidatus Lokiarchaeota archaeon]